jgi:hypothetical protein
MRWEDFEQIALMDWAECYPAIDKYLFHIRNEGKRSYAEGIKAKRMGLKRGVSDLFLAYPREPYAGFWIELKRPKTKDHPAGVLNAYQRDFLLAMDEKGYKTGVFYSWTDAAKAIAEYCGVKCRL